MFLDVAVLVGVLRVVLELLNDLPPILDLAWASLVSMEKSKRVKVHKRNKSGNNLQLLRCIFFSGKVKN